MGIKANCLGIIYNKEVKGLHKERKPPDTLKRKLKPILDDGKTFHAHEELL